MHLHILGICGTFMGGIAAIAKAAGHRVTGSDRNVYPPMSTQLQALGIDIFEGYDAAQLDPAPDVVVVGNVMVPTSCERPNRTPAPRRKRRSSFMATLSPITAGPASPAGCRAFQTQPANRPQAGPLGRICFSNR